jgi:hypothetical protein
MQVTGFSLFSSEADTINYLSFLSLDFWQFPLKGVKVHFYHCRSVADWPKWPTDKEFIVS